MTINSMDLQIGDDWAYREKAGTPLTPVRVTRVGRAKPVRVRVRFLDDDYEGREDWVPPSRLKVPWEQAGVWQAREDRWEAVRAASYQSRGTPANDAAGMVFDVLGHVGTRVGWGRDDGVLIARDIEDLCLRIAIAPEEANSLDPLSFLDDDGTFVAPSAVAEHFARIAAAAIGDELLNWVSDREREAQEKAIYGKDYGGRSGSGYVSAETCAKVDTESQPAYDLIREWCGAEAVARHDRIVLLEAEVASLRGEVLRLAQLVADAAEELRASGRPRVASALERSLGADPRTVRASSVHGDARPDTEGLDGSFHTYRVRRDPGCRSCGARTNAQLGRRPVP